MILFDSIIRTKDIKIFIRNQHGILPFYHTTIRKKNIFPIRKDSKILSCKIYSFSINKFPIQIKKSHSPCITIQYY